MTAEQAAEFLFRKVKELYPDAEGEASHILTEFRAEDELYLHSMQISLRGYFPDDSDKIDEAVQAIATYHNVRL